MNTRNQIKNQLRRRLARNHNGFPWRSVRYTTGETAIVNWQEYESIQGQANAAWNNGISGYGFKTLQTFQTPEIAEQLAKHPSKLAI